MKTLYQSNVLLQCATAATAASELFSHPGQPVWESKSEITITLQPLGLNVDLNILEVLPEGIVNEDVDLNMKVELEDEDDPLDDWYLIPYYHNYISVNNVH